MIEAKIAEYMRGDACEEARRACAEAHAFPLYLDWSACLAIRPDGEVVANLGEDWRPVMTLSPGLHHSPHYRLHGAMGQIRELEIGWEFGKMTPEARRQTARHVLHLWRQTGNYFQAGRYIQAVWERALEAAKSGKPIDVRDLPVP
jgi:hypothetical protein